MQLFIKHLTNVDSSILDAKYGLMGSSWIVDIILDGNLDEQGMVMDFGDVKKHIKKTIDDTVDHTLIVPTKSSNITIKEHENFCKIKYNFAKGFIEHTSPYEAITLLPSDDITTQILQEYLQEIVTTSLLDSNISVDLKLRQEEINGANYGYSHGLKKHGGNCQRIAHGHRSQIQIMEGENRIFELEESWSDHWHGKYLANKIDIIDSFKEKDVEYTTFSYQASQGPFTLTIPTICCSLIEEETTVEHLAQHICKSLTTKTGKKLKIFAYEGINKGSIATS